VGIGEQFEFEKTGRIDPEPQIRQPMQGIDLDLGKPRFYRSMRGVMYPMNPPGAPQRCGRCDTCKLVRSIKRMFSKLIPGGSEVTPVSVRAWNKILHDNPCEGGSDGNAEKTFDCESAVAD
jgi:hypothetical protein